MTCKCCKCNKPEFVVIDREGPCDLDVGEIGFRLDDKYDGINIVIHNTNDILVHIGRDGTLMRSCPVDDSLGLKLDSRGRIKVSE